MTHTHKHTIGSYGVMINLIYIFNLKIHRENDGGAESRVFPYGARTYINVSLYNNKLFLFFCFSFSVFRPINFAHSRKCTLRMSRLIPRVPLTDITREKTKAKTTNERFAERRGLAKNKISGEVYWRARARAFFQNESPRVHVNFRRSQ